MSLFDTHPRATARPRATASPRPNPVATSSPPSLLTIDGQAWTHCGRGRAPYSETYTRLSDRRVEEFHHAVVFEARPLYLRARPVNAALGLVDLTRAAVTRSGGDPLAAGDRLLIGPLVFDLDGRPRAERGWRVAVPAAPARTTTATRTRSTAASRAHGRALRIHPSGNYGEIGDGRPDGRRWFFHRNELRPVGATFSVGGLVSFVAARSDRGPVALDVRPI